MEAMPDDAAHFHSNLEISSCCSLDDDDDGTDHSFQKIET